MGLDLKSAPSADWVEDGSARSSLPPPAVVGRVWLSAPVLGVDPRLCWNLGDAGNVVPTATGGGRARLAQRAGAGH